MIPMSNPGSMLDVARLSFNLIMLMMNGMHSLIANGSPVRECVSHLQAGTISPFLVTLGGITLEPKTWVTYTWYLQVIPLPCLFQAGTIGGH